MWNSADATVGTRNVVGFGLLCFYPENVQYFFSSDDNRLLSYQEADCFCDEAKAEFYFTCMFNWNALYFITYTTLVCFNLEFAFIWQLSKW